jgi:hypothetical protein
MESQHFRMLFWQKLVILVPMPVFALMLAITPFTQSWSRTMWIVLAAVAASAILLYIVVQWLRADVLIDEDGLTFTGSDGRQTWPHEKLLKVKEIGRFRARMCYDPDIPDKHMHISLDLFRRADFTDALLGWYEYATGHELPELDSHEDSVAA